MTDLDTRDLDTDDLDTVGQRLEQACAHLAAAERSLTPRAPSLAELHAAVDGAVQVGTVLADLVATVMRQAPATLDHTHRVVLNEVMADLRAVHGCLTTGPLLLAPARDALHLLVTDRHAEAVVGEDRAPTTSRDRAAPLRPGRAEAADAVRVIHGVADVLEADPVDGVDQHRGVPHVAEPES